MLKPTLLYILDGEIVLNFAKKMVATAMLGGLMGVATSAMASTAVTPKAVIESYTDLAHTIFSDSLSTAKTLQSKIDAFVSEPTAENMQAAKDAWLAARIPYGQSEAFRFGNPNVDDWEGKVNAWPLDEGLIDYVKNDAYDSEEGNKFALANVIAGKEEINKELLESYHEKGGSEANVATGYHAVEFLLWGQDLNEKPTDAGLRSYTDFVKGDACTNGNCERRGQYLKAATDLLVSDLEDIVTDWAPKKDNYRKKFLGLEENEALRRMFFGMGSLSLGELAGERINVALLAHSQEDEHSCFSDNTHNDIELNARSIQNIFNANYTRADGSKFEGASLAALVAEKDKAVSEALVKNLETTAEKTDVLVKAAEGGEAFDQQIAAGNKEGQKRVKAVIAALRTQTADIESAAKVLGIDNLSPETSDSFQQ